MTYKEWFEIHPDLEMRARLLARLCPISTNSPTSSAQAVDGGFYWTKTPEGHEYWSDIAGIPWGPVAEPLFDFQTNTPRPRRYSRPVRELWFDAPYFCFHAYMGD